MRFAASSAVGWGGGEGAWWGGSGGLSARRIVACSSATDELNEVTKQVAIKKLARPFQTAIHAKRTYREIHMLKHMDHENVRSATLPPPGRSQASNTLQQTSNRFSLSMKYRIQPN